MKIAILGCGPAGMFATHAAIDAGHDVTILSKARKSFMRGAQYLHRPIPGLSGDSFKIDYQLDGTIEGYKDKVYGDITDVQVSPETLVGVSDAWDIREAYDRAWDLYSPIVQEWDIRWQGMPRVQDFDVIISTIPAKLLCYNPTHKFESQMIWSTDYIKYLGGFTLEDGTIADNVVRCSGDPDDWWYRQSRIQGWENTEYVHAHKPKTDRVWEVEKPLRNACTCYQDIVRMGRYGKWQKGVLSHEAYYDTQVVLAAQDHTLEPTA